LPEDARSEATAGIAREETYRNALGWCVVVFVPTAPGQPRAYYGQDLFISQTPHGLLSKPVVFPIDASTLEGAFEAWQTARADKLREMNRPRIALARTAPPGGNGGGRHGGK